MDARKRKCKLVSGEESPSEVKTDGRYKENELAITETGQFKKFGRRYMGDGTWKLELGTMEEKIKSPWPELHPHHPHGNKDLEGQSRASFECVY
ncbi:uncharacterized protein EAE97_010934 [Botrytis byssoidea]|uniref:Uncharacterized protein n=1 Tax=Botrytis byssoidea TaxID=139641 RepID=A0A9P5HZM2_9HELO|nr:uncharacterized protein EAE97_010934 [Botrytis byssoidea]KAF7922770.1 hypothetical protein EAE97_010934 [Botrytis byssoidea]